MSGSDKPSSPFAALAELRASLPPGPAADSADDAAPAAPDTPDPLSGKLVVAHTRKGRGGKTVTTIAGVRGDADVLAELARDLRKSLGCGATVDGALIVVQGDQVERVRALLTERGARRVVVGSSR